MFSEYGSIVVRSIIVLLCGIVLITAFAFSMYKVVEIHANTMLEIATYTQYYAANESGSDVYVMTDDSQEQ